MDNISLITTLILSVTGLIGAITGLVSVWIMYLNYSKDNLKVKVKALKRMQSFTPGVKGSMSEKSYLVIKAANAGKRPVIIEMAAYVSLKRIGGGISSDIMSEGPSTLKHEGDAVTYLMEDADIDYDDVNYVVVYDSIGNEYRAYLAPFHKRLYYWFLHVTYIRRKPTKAPTRLPANKKSKNTLS